MKTIFIRFSLLISIVVIGISSTAWAAEDMSSFVSHWDELEVKKINEAVLLQQRQITKGQTLDLKTLTIDNYTIAASAIAPERKNLVDFEELIIVKEGELKVTLNGKSKVMGAGSVLITYPGEKRVIKNVGKTPASYYVFNYASKLPANMSRGKKAGGSFMVDWDDVEYNKSDIGGRRDIFNRPTSMFKTFEMHVSTLNQGLTNHAAHTHRAEEFVLMIKGEVKMLVGKNTYSATTGDIVYIESMIPHSLNNTGKGETMYFAFQFWQ